MPHPYLKYFEDQQAETKKRVELDTERHRKAFARVKLVDGDGQPVTGARVRISQKTHDFKFGCNCFMLDQFPDEERNLAYRREFASLFNYAVAPFYWADFEPEDGQPRMGENPVDVYRRPAPEKVIRYCRENGIDLKGHPLFWHYFLPDWLPKDRDQVFRRLDTRLRELSGEYADRIMDWDCVNESLVSRYKSDKRLPREYPASIFFQAAKYFKNNRLFINDGTEISWDSEQGELSPYYLQLEYLMQKGVPIDGIGMQYHMFYKPEVMETRTEEFYNPQNLFDCMDLYGSFGRPLHISEITVPAYGGTQESKQMQALITEQLYRIWFSHPAAEAIVWWNLVDGTAAYAPFGSFDGENYYAGGLLNHDMSRKPVYDVLDRLIHKEWHTEVTVEEMPETLLFNGFYGKYDVTVEMDGRQFTQEIHLSRQGEREFHLVMTGDHQPSAGDNKKEEKV